MRFPTSFFIAAAIAWAGLCSAATDTYMIVDLSKGNGAPHEVSFVDTVPNGVSSPEYKTSKLLLKKIPSGTFMMGSPADEPGRATNGDEDQRLVTLTNDYYIGVFELTEGQYNVIALSKFLDDSSIIPAGRNTGGSLKFSTFMDDFLAELSRGAATNFCLPTEEQWEYACRAGTTTAYSFPDADPFETYGWSYENADGIVTNVGQKLPNGNGLYDMHGNAGEACAPMINDMFFVRGGNANRYKIDCRSAARPTTLNRVFNGEGLFGFRVCLTVPIKTYKVAVSNGWASTSSATNGQTVSIWANPPPADYTFDRWTGDTKTVADIFATNTTVTVSNADVKVTATYTYVASRYTLTVENGEGSGSYTNGEVVTIWANPAPAYKEFDQWTGDVAKVSDTSAATTTIRMTAANVTVKAAYKNIQYLLTVINGTPTFQTGAYGQWLNFVAKEPPANKVFNCWTGDTNTVKNIFSPVTSAQLLGTNITVTATYKDILFTLTVVSPEGTNEYRCANGEEVDIQAPPPPDYYSFRWAGDTHTVADVTATNTTLTMPPSDITVRATYTPISYTLTVAGPDASGSGSYTNGHVVEIKAPPLPDEHHTFRWAGDTHTVADVTATNTTLTMPPSNITVTATYPAVGYPLTVKNGVGSGSYTNGQVVTVLITNTPSAWHVFDRWTGDTGNVADLFAPTTTVTVAGGVSTTLTPTFRPLPVSDNTYMIVDLTASPGKAVSYTDEIPEEGWGETYKTDKVVLRKIPSGTFTIGSPAGEPGRGLYETQHKVTLTKSFYIGLFELTYGQWTRVMGGDGENGRNTCPVAEVSFTDIRGASLGSKWPASSTVESASFIGKVRTLTGDSSFDLPTEAQWEYACRAGTTGAYAGDLDEMALYSANSGWTAGEVGQLKPNAWGLYDMHGNVFEICLDWHADDVEYGGSAQTDPAGAVGSLKNGRVMRGGAYNMGAADCRSAYRSYLVVTNRQPFAGLRLTKTAGATYGLTVVNGQVNAGGVYLAGTKIAVSAVRKEGTAFRKWTVEPAAANLGALFDAARADTVVTMPSTAVTLKATYSTDANLTVLTVISGSGSGTYTNGIDVPIIADLPIAGQVFSGWTGDTGVVASVTSPTTTVFAAGGAFTVIATYTAKVEPAEAVAGVALSLAVDLGDGWTSYSAKGLPTGLKIDAKTGVIWGVPTKSGAYPVTVTGKNADGSASVVIQLKVDGLDAQAQGTFTGYVYDGTPSDGSLAVTGLLSMTVSSAGKISAKMKGQKATYSFSSTGWTTSSGDVYQVSLRTTKGETLAVAVDGTGNLTGALTGGAFGSVVLGVAGQRNAFLDKADGTAQARLARFKGYYTAALPTESFEGPAWNTQGGSGYVTFTVKDKGAVAVGGKLADGTAFSFSTTLLVDEEGGFVPVFVPLYSKRGLVSGVLFLRPDADDGLDDNRVENADGLPLRWNYPGKSATATLDGFTVNASAFGAYYDKLAKVQSHYEDTSFRAEAQEWNVPLAFKSSGAVYLAVGDENPARATLTVTQATGLFSGGFKTEGGNGKTVSVKHAGVLTRDAADQWVGEGFYMVPQSVKEGTVTYTQKPSFTVTIE